jgi:hypothetical protein
LRALRSSSALLRHPDFLKLWAAQAGSALGSRISRTALPIIAVLVLDSTNQQVALLSALAVLPAVLVGVFLSGPIERAKKRGVMVTSDVLRAALLVLVPVAAAGGLLGIWLLDGVAFLVGAASAAFRIADASVLPTIITPDLLVEGNARLEATDAVAEAAGPGLAGILIVLLGAPGAVLLDATSYLWSALWLGRLTSAPASAPERGGAAPKLSVFGDIASGVRACLRQPLVASTLAVEVMVGLSNGFFMALYMLLALRVMGLSPAVVGLVVSVGGLSSFLGASAVPYLSRRIALLPLMAVALALGQGADFLIAAAPSAGRFGVLLLVLQQFLGDGFCTIYAIHAVSVRQRLLEPSLLARGNGAFEVAAGVALPIGALIAGVAADHFGVQHAILLAGVLGVASTLALLFAADHTPTRRSPA